MFAEGNVTICNFDGLRLLEIVVEIFFTFTSLSCFLFIVMVRFSNLCSVIVKGVIAIVVVVMVCNAEGKVRVEESWGGEEDTFRFRLASRSSDVHL